MTRLTEMPHTGVPAVFLDRDGTLIEERHYLSDPEGVVLLPGVPAALSRLRQAGFRLVLVTNQSGVGRGYFTLDDLDRVHARLQEALEDSGAGLDRIYFAPEAPDEPSRGRKPSPQLLLDARDDLGLDLSRSYMVGDKWVDVQCGWNAGVARSILVRTGYGAEVEARGDPGLDRAWVVDDMAQAVHRILEAANAA